MAKIAKAKTSGMVIEDTAPVEAPVEETAVAEEVAIPVEEETDLNEINIDEDIIQKAPVKNVRINPAVDHSCSIGGVRYYLKKGVCQNVPLEVKEIFAKAGLLSPL